MVLYICAIVFETIAGLLVSYDSPREMQQVSPGMSNQCHISHPKEQSQYGEHAGVDRDVVYARIQNVFSHTDQVAHQLGIIKVQLNPSYLGPVSGQ